jgi:alpha-1,6-mannosyltransferase
MVANTALATEALACFLPDPSGLSQTKRYRLALYLLTLAAVIFRSEIAVLLATHILFHLIRRRISLTKEIIPAVFAGSLVGLAITVYIDSYFWQSFPLWPEFTGFFYNIVHGKSSNWGTSPWYYYFVNALPRLLLNPITYLLCIPTALAMQATRTRSLDILIPCLSFVAIYSFLPHKEWRFIVYIIPSLTAVAAVGAQYIWSRRSKSFFYRILSLSLLSSFAFTAVLYFFLLLSASFNYPGGIALQRLHQIADGTQSKISVHMDDLTLTTGVTRFLQVSKPLLNSTWSYDKTDRQQELLTPAFWSKFDYAIVERPEKAIGTWETVDEIDGFGGVRLSKTQYAGSVKGQKWNEKVVRVWNTFGNTYLRKYLGGYWLEFIIEPKLRIIKLFKMTIASPGGVRTVEAMSIR